MARFKNVSGSDLSVFSPAGFPSSFLAEDGQVVEVPGEVTSETDDAYVVGEDDHARAWPKAQWEAVGAAPRPSPANTDSPAD